MLLSHLIKNNALEPAILWGIREDDFVTDEARAIYQKMLRLKRDPRYKNSAPGVHTVANDFPTFTYCDDDSMSLEAYCTLVRENHLSLELQSIARELVTSAGDPVARASNALKRVQRNVLAVGYGQRNDIDFSEALARALVDHDLLGSGVDLSVAKWPWDPFNEATGGLQKDDYIVFYGRPKSKKSWVLAYWCCDLFRQGKFPLIYTKEMTADNIFRRVGACIAEVDYQDFRRGHLDTEARERLRIITEAARDVRATQPMLCLNGKDTDGGDTVEWLEAKVKRYKPDVVLIDGLYLMSDGKGAKGQKDNFRVQNISRGIRQMILDTEIPVICTMQATRTAAAHKNANLDEIAFTDAVAQDVTAAVRVINEDNAGEGTREGQDLVNLLVGGSREWTFSGCQIAAECATDFGLVRYLDSREANRIKSKDDNAAAKEAGPPAGKPTRDPVTSKRLVDDLKKRDAKLLEARISKLPTAL